MPADRTRRFVLPGIQDLNQDQDAALALPLEGQHLIIGGPGTGKSVVALLRARRLAAEENQYRVLVYNHLLNGANRHLFGLMEPLVSKTWDKWFRDMFRHIFHEEVPIIPQVDPKAYQPIDWEAVENAIAGLVGADLPLGQGHFILIDEGQDMPPQFYFALVSWGVENFYVVADQNQQLQPDRGSSRQEIENALAIDPADTLELRVNYRNSRPIARLAQHLCPADPAVPMPDLPAPIPGSTPPELWTYGAAGQPSLNDVIVRILQLSDRFPRKLIGIISPNNQVRMRFCNALNFANPKLDNGRPPVQTYAAGQEEPLEFGKGGIMVINAQSCKGLEFDIVILADIDRHQPITDLYVLRSRFYVMVARGREQVILLRTGEPSPVVEGLLPAVDSPILVRK